MKYIGTVKIKKDGYKKYSRSVTITKALADIGAKDDNFIVVTTVKGSVVLTRMK